MGREEPHLPGHSLTVKAQEGDVEELRKQADATWPHALALLMKVWHGALRMELTQPFPPTLPFTSQGRNTSFHAQSQIDRDIKFSASRLQEAGIVFTTTFGMRHTVSIAKPRRTPLMRPSCLL